MRLLYAHSLLALSHIHSNTPRLKIPTLSASRGFFMWPQPSPSSLPPRRSFLFVSQVKMKSSIPDPDVFWPPGSASGSVIYLHGSGSCKDPDPFINKQKTKKKLDFYCFVTSLWLFICEEWCKWTFKKDKHNKKNFLLASWSHWRKRSGSGAVSQRLESEDPDPYQNVTDPEHWTYVFLYWRPVDRGLLKMGVLQGFPTA